MNNYSCTAKCSICEKIKPICCDYASCNREDNDPPRENCKGHDAPSCKECCNHDNHIKFFHRTLIRFATYLQSQNIRYRLYSDYDGEFIIPINSKYYFGVKDNKLCRFERLARENKFFDLMPIREDIIS